MNEPQNLVNFVKPHKAVPSSTVSKWRKQILEIAATETDIFKGHSTGAASSTKADISGISFWYHQIGSLQWCNQNFFGQTGTHMEPAKAPSWLATKSVPPDAPKMHSLGFSLVRFLCKTFFKLLKLLLWKTLFYRWFLKNSYIKIKNVYGYNLAGASRRSELRKMQQVEQKESNETV